jgi:hypothetical protein
VFRQVLYRIKINASRREAWWRVIAGFEEGTQRPASPALCNAAPAVPELLRTMGVSLWLDTNCAGRGNIAQWGAYAEGTWVRPMQARGAGGLGNPNPRRAGP